MIKFFFIFLLISNLFAGERLRWESVKTPLDGNYFRIIDSGEHGELWIYDKNFNLYHYNGKSWKIYQSPFNKDLNPKTMLKISSRKFFSWALDENYFSQIRIFEGDRWTAVNYSTELPLQGIIAINHDELLLFGNFGLLINFKDNKFSRIESPLKNHIWSAIKANDGSIWLAGNYDGVYKYENDRFARIEFEDGLNYAINHLIEKDNTIYAYHNEYNVFQLKNNKFFKTAKKWNEITGVNQENKVGIFTYSSSQSDKKISLEYPANYKTTQIYAHNDSNIYIVANNELKRGVKTDQFYFYELASSYLLAGAKHNAGKQVFVRDLNNSGYNDIVLLNSYPADFNSMYTGSALSPFQERPFILNDGLERLSSRAFEFADLNNNYLDDIIVSFNDSVGSGIIIFLNNKDFTFLKHKKIYSPRYLLNSPVKNIECFDFDNDGDLDIVVSYYYGEQEKPGNEVVYFNKFNGQLFESDTSFAEITRGWNIKSTFIDIDNDGDLDWYISNLWWSDKLLLNDNGKYTDVSDIYLGDSLYLNTTAAAFADIDNDGDLDLIRSCDEQLIVISLNNGSGYFKDATDSLISKNLKLNVFSYGSEKTFNMLDINNDGFIDILLTTAFSEDNKTMLLLNRNGKQFDKFLDEHIPESETFYSSAVFDVDRDGDKDIFLIRDGENKFLVNNLDDSNYLRINLFGVSSSTDARNSKIYIYKAGGLNNKDSLIAYRETGIDRFVASSLNESTIHFGLDNRYEYDIRILFRSGKEKIISHIKPPSVIDVYEHEGIYKNFVLLSNNLFNLSMQKEIQIYFLITLLTIFIIAFSIRTGHEKFNWGIKLSISLLIINFSFYWIILFLTNSSGSTFLKYYFPSLIAIIGVAIPNLLFFSIKWNILKRNLRDYKDELLDNIIHFLHGEWAIKNINSIIFLLQSGSHEITQNEKFKMQLKTRIKTYDSMTAESIAKITSICRQIDYNNELIKHLAVLFDESKIIARRISNDDFLFTEKERNVFKMLKDAIKEISGNILAEYSCQPIEVIDRLLEANKSVLKKNKISVEFVYKSDMKNHALIKANELADILDNLISNAVKALRNKINPMIVIEIIWLPPKFYITAINNGEKINREDFEIIFEKGYSRQGSSGMGLYYSRKILNKYGGRITLLSSDEQWTKFQIELNEGYKNETAYSNNR